MDYYSTLGVAKNATDKELKAAYKKASMKHHPDRGGDENRFKEINEAYSTLKDPQKRGMYDHQQNGGGQAFNFNTGNMGGGHPFEDIFGSMFGQHAQRQRHQNQDIRLRVKLDLHEVLTGKKVIASFRLRSGKEESVNLDIPPGIHHGDTMKFPHLGDNTVPGPRGNLFVEVHINHMPNWARNQNDLKTSITVNCLELITGTKVKVSTLDGRDIELTIPKGTKNGTTFSVHGHGVPDVHYGQKGKLLITIQASIPNGLTDIQLNQIREIIRDNGKF